MINEEQRDIIERALRGEKVTGEEAEVLTEMFTELPEKDKEHPDCLHGFCL